MKPLRPVIVLAVFLAAGCTSETDLRAEVEALLDRFVTAVAAGDTAAIRGFYAADDRFAWLEDGQVRYRSADDVLAGLAALPAGAPVRTQIGPVEAVAVGDGAAHAWAPFETTVGTGDSAFSFRGLMSFVLERTDGSWRIVGGHTSAPRPR